MSAGAALIAEATAAGVTLARIGDGRLKWRSAVPPPPDLLARIVAAKAEVLAELVRKEAEWWRDFFEERAAIREHDGGMSCADAESGAMADCLARWRALNPLSASGDGDCVHWGGAEPDTPVLARGGHAWLHRACWTPMIAARERDAVAAVRALLKAAEPG
jgi:hypothetical protein